jgi:CBS domain containing-hemolysin-like protein
MANRIGQFLGGRPIGAAQVITEEEIKTLVDVGEEKGVIEQDEREMIYSIFEFRDRVVREVMVPRIDIVAVDVSTSMVEALDVIMQAGYSRIPVYDDNIDRVLGLLYAKDLLHYLRHGQTDVPLQDVLREPYFIPETNKVDELLPDLQRRKVHVAIVVDEYGGVAGLVTIEDLLEEIVGEIQDEYDAEEPLVEALGDGAYVFDARIPLDDVNKRMGIELASSVADTLGGYVYEQLGQVPSVNAQIAGADVEITVMSVSGRRIKRVRVVPQTFPDLPDDMEDGTPEVAPEEQKSARAFNPLNLFLG